MGQSVRDEHGELEMSIAETSVTDIIDRLDSKISADGGTDLLVCCRTEILMLRAAVRKLRQVAGAVSIESQSFSDIRKEIRKPFEPPDYDAFDANQSQD